MLVATRATTAFRTSMAFLGGPVGIALLAAYAIYEFSNSVARAREELGRGLGPLEDFRKSLEGLTTAQFAVRRLDIEIDVDKTQGEIDRLQGRLEDIQRTLRRGFVIAGAEVINLPADEIRELNDELIRGQADIDLYNQRIRDLQARLDVLSFVGPPELPESAAPEADDPEALDEKARERVTRPPCEPRRIC